MNEYVIMRTMEIGSGTEAGYRAKRKYVARARIRFVAAQPCSFDRLERAEQQETC